MTGQVWVTVVATVEVSVGPYPLDENFQMMAETSESEAINRLRKIGAEHKVNVMGLPLVVGFRAELFPGQRVLSPQVELPLKPWTKCEDPMCEQHEDQR